MRINKQGILPFVKREFQSENRFFIVLYKMINHQQKHTIRLQNVVNYRRIIEKSTTIKSNWQFYCFRRLVLFYFITQFRKKNYFLSILRQIPVTAYFRFSFCSFCYTDSSSTQFFEHAATQIKCTLDAFCMHAFSRFKNLFL